MLQYQPKRYQMCPSAYGVDATSIRIGTGKSLTSLGACQVQRFFLPLQLNNQPFSFLQNGNVHARCKGFSFLYN